MPIEISNPAWWTVKLHALRIFLAPSVKMGSLSVSFLIAGFIQILIGLVVSLNRLEVRRLWVFGGCWLIAALLPLAQYLRIAATGEVCVYSIFPVLLWLSCLPHPWQLASRVRAGGMFLVGPLPALES